MLFVLCRSPADDGWIAVEDHTAVVYTVFDSVAYLYRRIEQVTTPDSDLRNRAKQARLLARAEWLHYPTPADPVPRGGLKRLR